MDTSFEQFVRANLAALGRYAYALAGGGDHRNDLLQDTLEKVARAWRRIDSEGAPLAYARKVMFRTYVSAWRLTRHRPAEVPLIELPGEDDSFGRVDRRDLLRRALATLPRGQRAVLVLGYLDGASDDAIAETLGCRPATVRSLRHRGLAALRKQINDGEPAVAGKDGHGRR
jgi:RNA polymerase sigma-70 factor (sigma-E family)